MTNDSSPYQTKISLTPSDSTQLQVVAKAILDANLDRYQLFSDVENGRVDPSLWKLVKTNNEMSAYLQRQRRLVSFPFQVDPGHDNCALQSLLCVGSTPSKLDRVMDKVANPREGDMSRAALLATITKPTTSDPFKSIKVKWMDLNVRFQSLGLVKNHDYVYVEATGVLHLPSGGRLGYQLLHSVDVPGAHDLPGLVRTLHLHESRAAESRRQLQYLLEARAATGEAAESPQLVQRLLRARVQLVQDREERAARELRHEGDSAEVRLLLPVTLSGKRHGAERDRVVAHGQRGRTREVLHGRLSIRVAIAVENHNVRPCFVGEMPTAFGNENPAIQEVQANKPTLLPTPAADSNSSESHIDQPGSGKSKPSVAAEAQLQTTKLQTSGMTQERWSGNVQTKVTARIGSTVMKYNFEPIVCTLVGLVVQGVSKLE
ncbi:hypothetical protein ON010_g147 [Phytophthora cinnamomi]|nr:hypothetical protein ON010_g147 [Phytophthora cinnamomi]